MSEPPPAGTAIKLRVQHRFIREDRVQEVSARAIGSVYRVRGRDARLRLTAANPAQDWATLKALLADR